MSETDRPNMSERDCRLLIVADPGVQIGLFGVGKGPADTTCADEISVFWSLWIVNRSLLCVENRSLLCGCVCVCVNRSILCVKSNVLRGRCMNMFLLAVPAGQRSCGQKISSRP